MKKKKYISLFLTSILILSANTTSFAEDISQKDNQTDTLKITTKTNQSTPLTPATYKEKTASELSQMVKDGLVSPRELVELAYQVIEEENPNLNAVITTRKEDALKEADELTNSGQEFFGVPILLKGIGHTVKNGENTNGLMTKVGSISKSDASYTKKFKELGFIVIGQTNYPELALRNITNSKLYGLAKNPWDTNYNAGGSSGGSASSVSSGMTPVASASDMGGSIRIPASWNSLIGLKTSSAVTTNGNKFASPVVHFPITKSSLDTEKLFEGLLNDKYKPDILAATDIKNLTIAYTTKSPMNTTVSQDAIDAVNNAVDFLKAQGFNLVEITEPIIDGRSIMYDYTIYSIANGSLAGNLEKDLKAKSLTKYDVDPLVWALYQANKSYGKADLTKDIETVKNNFEKYRETMTAFHQKYPILLTPTTAYTAPLNSDSLIDEADKVALYDIENLTKNEQIALLVRQWEPMLKLTPFTQLANVTGNPAISLPTYLSKDNLPLGIMLSANWGMDRNLISFAKYFEASDMLILKLGISPIKYAVINENITADELPTYVGIIDVKLNPNKQNTKTPNPKEVLNDNVLEEKVNQAIIENTKHQTNSKASHNKNKAKLLPKTHSKK